MYFSSHLHSNSETMEFFQRSVFDMRGNNAHDVTCPLRSAQIRVLSSIGKAYSHYGSDSFVQDKTFQIC